VVEDHEPAAGDPSLEGLGHHVTPAEMLEEEPAEDPNTYEPGEGTPFRTISPWIG
jgi:hypothetical protein